MAISACLVHSLRLRSKDSGHLAVMTWSFASARAETRREDRCNDVP